MGDLLESPSNDPVVDLIDDENYARQLQDTFNQEVIDLSDSESVS